MKEGDNSGFKINFIGIGSGKSGTTWLADKLRLHPQIFIPAIKEIEFFNKLHNLINPIPNFRHNKTLQWYQRTIYYNDRRQRS